MKAPQENNSSTSETSSCDHDHKHGHAHDHSHDHNPFSLTHRWLLSVLIVGVLLILLRSFIVGQMLVRVTSYSANSSYNDAIRICKKIIVIDGGNKQAWTALGYAYIDLGQALQAIDAFEKVLALYPDDKGAASFELGEACFSTGNYSKAIEYYERVRSAGPHAAALLEADVLKYRHGTLGFRSLNSMQTLLAHLLECYKQAGDDAQAAEIQKEYDIYKNKHSKILF